ncbi:astacin-like [Anopheles funestus]|uniref:astacin-like n=1 Tax=Anopheles funestus TaxID=62324 RepID=UPI0020C66879|nr:astacin-like [Anopheles funestus]
MKPLKYLIIVAMALCVVQLSVGFKLSDYTKPSKEVGKRLRARRLLGYPHEYGFGYYYQGDILLRPGEKNRIAIIQPLNYDVWPNATVPYEIEANFSAGETETLLAAFAQYANRTCIRFVERTDELQYVTITNNGEGCYSNVGRNPDPTDNMLNLQTPDCMESVGTPVHELMHTLGFLHEQARPDRDLYVDFFPQNLELKYQTPGFISTNFGIYNEPSSNYGQQYNYGSVMHYSRYAGAASMNAPVLTNKQAWFGDFGNENGLSDGDVAQLMARYCPDNDYI